MANMFALRDSSLNAFLFSDVGVEPNGTGLTILSLLARLGKDPWEEAAVWARKPKAAAVRLLTDSIVQMPPSQQALDEAPQTALRLVSLLPEPEAASVAAVLPSLAAVPRGVLLAVLYLSLFLVFNFWFGVRKPGAVSVPAPHAVVAGAPATHAQATGRVGSAAVPMR